MRFDNIFRYALIGCLFFFVMMRPAWAQWDGTFSSPYGNQSLSMTGSFDQMILAAKNQVWPSGGYSNCSFPYGNNYQEQCIYGGQWKILNYYYMNLICASPLVVNAAGTDCEDAPAPPPPPPPPPCPAVGTVLSSGFYDVGTSPKMANNQACANGCRVLFGGSINSTSIVDGVKHYWAEGNYVYNGYPDANPAVSTCPNETMAMTEYGAPAVEPTCAVGQILLSGTNGLRMCFDSVTGAPVNTDSASAVADVQTMAAEQTAAQMQAAASAVIAAGGSASDVAAAQSVVAGVAAVGGVTGGGSGGSDSQSIFCDLNPASPLCTKQDFGEVGEVTLTEKTINVSITPVAVGPSGTCPAPSPMVIHGTTGYFQWTTYCNFANGIRPILLAFAWLSAAGLLVGGFRSA